MCDLIEELTKVVQHIMLRYPRLRQYVFLHGAVRDEQELRAVSLGCAYLAYTSLGGTPENAPTFDWTAQQDELVLETRKRIAHELITNIRKGTRRKRLSLDEYLLGREGISVEFDDPFANELASNLLYTLRSGLSEGDWQVLDEVYLQEQSCDEVALAHLVAVNVIHQRVSRARTRARKLLNFKKESYHDHQEKSSSNFPNAEAC